MTVTELPYTQTPITNKHSNTFSQYYKYTQKSKQNGTKIQQDIQDKKAAQRHYSCLSLRKNPPLREPTHPFTEADDRPEGASTGTQAKAAATQQPAGRNRQRLPQHSVDTSH